jgi:hypothetical protein
MPGDNRSSPRRASSLSCARDIPAMTTSGRPSAQFAVHCVADGAKARKLVRIFAPLIAQEIASFDQIEELFGPLRRSWGVLVREFLEELAKIGGEWMDKILESEFRRMATFFASSQSLRRLQSSRNWKLSGSCRRTKSQVCLRTGNRRERWTRICCFEKKWESTVRNCTVDL